MLNLPDVWFVVIVICLVWYSTVTVYVAIRGALDIKGMLARLGRSKTEDESPD
jgi:hypothetical protein